MPGFTYLSNAAYRSKSKGNQNKDLIHNFSRKMFHLQVSCIKDASPNHPPVEVPKPASRNGLLIQSVAYTL